MQPVATWHSPAEATDAGVTPCLLATRRLSVLEHFRVPYLVAPDHAGSSYDGIGPPGGGPTLLWPKAFVCGSLRPAMVAAADGGPEIPIFARLMPDAALADDLKSSGWKRTRAILDPSGHHLSSMWARSDGSLLLPFDPDVVVQSFWSEAYLATSRALRQRVQRSAMHTYYRLRPLIPRTSQLWIRRQFTRIQRHAPFPRWPVETALDDFVRFLFGILSDLTGQGVPRIANWPDGRTWALVLTHDVEQSAGYRAIRPITEVERRHGVRSAWYFVPRRYPINDDDLDALRSGGFEVGVHGLYHDGRDLSPAAELRKRLPAIRQAAQRWGATGFRAPALHRDWGTMPTLGFEYDSSFPDTDPYEPMPGGCCSSTPFFIQKMVELPITLPQDHTLFVILGHRDETIWGRKTQHLRDTGGMALIDTHPDYLVQGSIFSAYERFLSSFAADANVWHALPREVAAWWRDRAASHLRYVDGEWTIIGPAAERGRVDYST